MAILKPPQDLNLNISSVLASAGITSPRNSTGSSASQAFADAGAGIDDIAQVTAAIMKSAESEGVRLQACRFASEVHKIIDKNVQVAAAPEISITIVSPNNNGLIGVLMPSTDPLNFQENN